VNDTKTNSGSNPTPAKTAKKTLEAETDSTVPVDEKPAPPAQSDETGGPRGPEPTRFGDWERKGRCIDF